MPRPDPFLPVSPAQVKVLVLPVGPMHRDRFASFLERLQSEDAVHLRDVSADSRPNRSPSLLSSLHALGFGSLVG